MDKTQFHFCLLAPKKYRLAKVNQITAGPYWLMVVHDRNVANRISNEYRANRVGVAPTKAIRQKIFHTTYSQVFLARRF